MNSSTIGSEIHLCVKKVFGAAPPPSLSRAASLGRRAVAEAAHQWGQGARTATVGAVLADRTVEARRSDGHNSSEDRIKRIVIFV
jgi:hypothetical protein